MFEIYVAVKWPQKGWYAVKQPTSQPTFENL